LEQIGLQNNLGLKFNAAAYQKRFYNKAPKCYARGKPVKRQTLTAALLSILVFSMLAGALVRVSSSNPYVPTPIGARIKLSLLGNESQSYGLSGVPVQLTVESKNPSIWEVTSVYGVKFYLDGDSCDDVWACPVEMGDKYVFTSILIGLGEGNHSLYVVAYVTYHSKLLWLGLGDPDDGSGASNVVHFVVDCPPEIAILSVKQRQAFSVDSVPLVFSVSEPVSWVSYSFDGQDNVTVAGNTTLTGLPNGEHNVKVYAIDDTGNVGVSETITFTVNAFPTMHAIMIVAVAIVFSVGLLVYFLRRKRKRE